MYAALFRLSRHSFPSDGGPPRAPDGTLGIYDLEDDGLKICFPEGRKGERSTAFESKPNSVNDVLIVLEREQP